MNSWKKILVFNLLLVLWTTVAPSQSLDEKLVFRQLDGDLGLSSSNVMAILRGPDEMMWFGTGFGLYRYDGTRVKSFFSSRDSLSLSHNSIQKLYNGPFGYLWIENVNGKFDLYDPVKQRVHRGLDLVKNRISFSSDSISSILKDRQGRYWFAHPEKGITIFDSENQQSIHLTTQDNQGGLSSNQIAAIQQNPDGLIWVLSRDGYLDLVDPFRLITSRSAHLKETADFGSSNFEMLVDSDGDAWIFDPDRDLGLIWVKNLSLDSKKIDSSTSPLRLNNNMVKAITEAKPGEIWLGTDHGGINILDKKTQQITYLNQESKEAENYPHHVVYALFKDSEDILWIGTHKQGVSYYHPGLLRFSHVQKNLSDKQSLPFNDVNAFVEDQQGNLYIGTNGGGLLYQNRKTGAYSRYLHDPDNSNSLVGDVIVDMVMDKKGVLWMGTYLNGLGSFDGKNFRSHEFLGSGENSIPGPNVWKLFEDSRNRLWIGTLRSGLAVLDSSRQHFTSYPAGAAPYYIHNQYITGFAEDTAGNIWVAGGSGVNAINLETGQTRFYSEDTDHGLLASNITDLFVDRSGMLWLTSVNGLHYFDNQDSTFVHFGTEDGLPTSYLVDILEDQKGNLWISSQAGLSYGEVDRSREPLSITFQNFDQKDGLQAALFNKNSALKTQNNELIFGGPNGYNIFKSENFAFEQNYPQVVFTDLSLFNKEVTVGEIVGKREVLQSSLQNAGEVVLRHDENMFSIGFSALNFLYPEKNKYRYKLLGFNEDWIYLDENLARVSFTNLDPGDYTLVVQPGTVLEGWSPEEFTLKIKILAPFWKTPLAYFLYFLVMIGSVVYFRNQLIKRQKEQFERKQAILESKRIQELDRLKTKFFTNLSHEFRTPLSLILTPAEHLLSTTEDKSLKNHYEIIQRNARRLLKLINQLLDIKNIEKGALVFHPTEGDIVNFVREVVSDFQELSENQHKQLTFESNVESQQAIFDSDKLEKIIFNLLSNAFKFTFEDGKIHVKLELTQTHEERARLELTVSDTGIGISPESQERIFERFYSTDPPTNQLNQGSGIGLSLVWDFVKIMNGEIFIQSELNQGASFIVQIPLDLIHLEEIEEREQLLDELTRNQKEVVLIAEDHVDFRNYLKDCLSDTYQVLLAANGAEAWEIAQEQIPDLIISDLMMPTMDGNELCQHVKGNLSTSHIPVILLTAKKSEEQMLQSLDSGCNLYLTKPFNLEVLNLSIKNLLKERKAYQEQNRRMIQVKPNGGEVASMDQELIQKAAALVEEHIDDSDFSVEYFASQLHMSRVHLYKKLQSLTGKSPIEFIRLIRMQRAAELLAKGQWNVNEVAYMVGYNNAKYFAKQFKNEYGKLPSEYSAH
ncbi:hybrid sensor histidine kinase/response regulator transcription factor [Algoriphagus vanfongensis]|uniref:hybrid sensor histidine kinase/response regulator transcription factor n=1 Tax=Algoriphagus vanfongensis TaxID=426371 RepID=UPI001B7F8425|nr:two-component regulator propeller domain-containing protein [Algoriphagus vanfongensis]